MEVYIYQADIYCDDCGQEIIDKLRREARDKADEQVRAVATDLETRFGLDPDKFPKFFTSLENSAYRQLVPDISDESSYDSDEFPKGPFGDGGGESDCPQHCGACHEFLENPLTTDGYQYVRENYRAEWDSFYDITREEPGEYSEETEARLNRLRETNPTAYDQLTVLQPFQLTESAMVEQLDMTEVGE